MNEMCVESSLPLIALFNAHQMVCATEIQLGKKQLHHAEDQQSKCCSGREANVVYFTQTVIQANSKANRLR